MYKIPQQYRNKEICVTQAKVMSLSILFPFIFIWFWNHIQLCLGLTADSILRDSSWQNQGNHMGSTWACHIQHKHFIHCTIPQAPVSVLVRLYLGPTPCSVYDLFLVLCSGVISAVAWRNHMGYCGITQISMASNLPNVHGSIHTSTCFCFVLPL